MSCTLTLSESGQAHLHISSNGIFSLLIIYMFDLYKLFQLPISRISGDTYFTEKDGLFVDTILYRCLAWSSTLTCVDYLDLDFIDKF